MMQRIVLADPNDQDHCLVLTDGICKLSGDPAIKPQGIGGKMENGDLVGMYAQGQQAYFIVNDKRIRLNPKTFYCKNPYINEMQRQFTLENDQKIVYQTVYQPIFDREWVFNMQVMGEDVEKYDILLYLYNNVLSSEEALRVFLAENS